MKTTPSMLIFVTLGSAAIAGPLIWWFIQDNSCNMRTGRAETMNITNLTFGPSPNQITFALWNSPDWPCSPSSDKTISMATVAGGGINGTAQTTRLSANFISKGTSMNLTATFQGVNFTKGTHYDFRLILSDGNSIPYSETAP